MDDNSQLLVHARAVVMTIWSTALKILLSMSTGEYITSWMSVVTESTDLSSSESGGKNAPQEWFLLNLFEETWRRGGGSLILLESWSSGGGYPTYKDSELVVEKLGIETIYL